MARQIGSTSSSRPQLGTVVAGLGLLGAVAVGALNFVVTHVLVQTVPFAIGLGCLIWLYAASGRTADDTRRRHQAARTRSLSTAATSAITILFNVGVGLLVLIAVLTGGRGLGFYLVASLCGSLLLLLIVFADDRDLWPPLVIGQILVFAFVVRFAALVLTPSWIGIDIWIHMPEYVAGILATNSLAPLAESKYLVAPLYHLLVSTTAILGDVSARAGLFLSAGVVMPFSILLVYTTAIHLLDVRWALFAAAVYSMSDFVIVWGLHLIPTSLGLVFFLACAGLLIRQMCVPDSTDIQILVIVIGFLVAITFTHQVSAFIMLVFLAAGVLIQLALTHRVFARMRDRVGLPSTPADSIVNLTGYAIFAIGLIVFAWSITPWQGGNFIHIVLSLLVTSIAGGNVGLRGNATVATGGSEATWIVAVLPYIDYIGLILLLFATVVATLYTVDRWTHSQPHLTILGAGALMLFFTFVPPFFGLRTLLPGRWFAFLYLPLVLLTAIGLSTVRADLSPRSFAVILVIFVLVFPGSMILTTDATLDQPAFDDHNPRFAYTATELSGMDTVHEITDTDVEIYTDFPLADTAAHYNDTDRFAGLFVTSDPDAEPEIAEDATWRLYREYQTTGAPFWNDPESATTHSRQLSHETVCDRPTDHIAYSNGDLELCGASAG